MEVKKKMPELITKKDCPHFGEFKDGDCEFCIDMPECEHIAYMSKEANRKPTDDWIKQG